MLKSLGVAHFVPRINGSAWLLGHLRAMSVACWAVFTSMSHVKGEAKGHHER